MTFPNPNPVITTTQLALMAEALHLARFLISGDRAAANPTLVGRRRDRIRDIQQTLQTWGHPVQKSPLPVPEIPLAVRQAFVRSLLLVGHYGTVGSAGWRGTVPSPTLDKFRADPVPVAWYQPEWAAELCVRFQLDADWATALQADLAAVDADIQTQRRLMAAVLNSVGMSPDPTVPLTQGQFAKLLSHLFNGLALPATQVHGLVACLQLYFCLGFAEAEDNPILRSLQQQINSFSFDQFRRFPTFGPCHPTGIDGDWVEQLSDRTGLSATAITQRLSKNIGVLPLAEAEKFLIHDIWGHYWQLVLSAFESDYTSLADCDQPLRAGETAYTAGGPLTCRELFDWTGDQVKVKRDLAQTFFHGEVCQRLGLMFTHLLGELVADIAEFKFTWTNPEAAHELPSSSAFTDYPTNLDLSLADLDFLFLKVLQPLLAVNLSALEASPLEVDLLADFQAQTLEPGPRLRLEANLKGAIAQLHQIFYEEYSREYLPTLATEESLFAQIALNLLHLQNVINTLYRDPDLARSAGVPFQDVLMVFISAYCSGNSFTEFWSVDNVLADYFVPCWQALNRT
ncbi:MAG: hypothetical protein O3A14_06320 [Cyanobacteria bacterium]|nr:hypothetical protein [Cyanobacteriota bacterium]